GLVHPTFALYCQHRIRAARLRTNTGPATAAASRRAVTAWTAPHFTDSSRPRTRNGGVPNLRDRRHIVLTQAKATVSAAKSIARQASRNDHRDVGRPLDGHLARDELRNASVVRNRNLLGHRDRHLARGRLGDHPAGRDRHALDPLFGDVLTRR